MLAHATTRRTMLATTAAAAVSAAAPALASTIRPEPGDDSALFAMIARLNDIERKISALNAKANTLFDQLPSTTWTDDEIKAHRIEGAINGNVTLDVIERIDKRDFPGLRRLTLKEAGDTMMLTAHHSEYTEADEAAWRARCAARRELFDAKKQAYDEAYAALGLPRLFERIDAAEKAWCRAFERIADHQPATVAGALAMLRVYKQNAETIGETPRDKLPTAECIFVSALAALEGLFPGRPESADSIVLQRLLTPRVSRGMVCRNALPGDRP